MLLPGEVTATAWLPTYDGISARQCSYLVSARQTVHLPRVRPLSGGDDVTGRQPTRLWPWLRQVRAWQPRPERGWGVGVATSNRI